MTGEVGAIFLWAKAVGALFSTTEALGVFVLCRADFGPLINLKQVNSGVGFFANSAKKVETFPNQNRQTFSTNK